MQTSIRSLLAFLGAVAGLLVLVPVILLAIPLWLVGWLHSVARDALARSRPATIPWEQMMAYEPEVGWKPLPGLDAWAEGTPPFHVRTDSEGWRGPGVSIEDAQVVVFGDSFCFGHGADEERFFANLTGGPVVKAIGANGYNMVQGLMWMKRYSKRLAGRTVVWLVYYGNDLLDNLRPNMGRYRIPFVRRGQGGNGGWEIASQHVNAEPWRFSTKTDYTRLLAEICSPTFLSGRVFEACDYLMCEAARVCADAGARLVVVGNPDVEMIDPELVLRLRARAPDPSSFDPKLPDTRFAEICERYGLPFVPLSERLGPHDHLPEDVHWSPEGHEIVHGLMSEIHDSWSGAPSSPTVTASAIPEKQVAAL